MLIFLYFRENRHQSIAQKLKNIPSEEQECLEFFFRSHFNCLGYALFGDKPMAVMGYNEPKSEVIDIYDMLDRSFGVFDPYNLKAYRGWKLWKKYQHFLPMKNYAFVESKNFVENSHVALVFINKKAFLNTVAMHLNDFKNVLGDHITPEGLLEEVLKSNDIFGEVLKRHQGIIGTILGFGRHNAWLFHRREEMTVLSGKMSPLLGKPRNFVRRVSNAAFQNQLDALDKALQSFDDRATPDFNLLQIGLPRFVADPNDPETKRLKIEYEKQYRQIIHRYQKGDFLEITLQQMTSEDTP